jgi:hypothetical protein
MRDVVPTRRDFSKVDLLMTILSTGDLRWLDYRDSNPN